jgi:hypothetical protein
MALPSADQEAGENVPIKNPADDPVGPVDDIVRRTGLRFRPEGIPA